MAYVTGFLALSSIAVIAVYLPAIIADGSGADPRTVVALVHAPLALLLLAKRGLPSQARWLAAFLTFTAVACVIVSVLAYVNIPFPYSRMAVLSIAPIALAGGALLRFTAGFGDLWTDHHHVDSEWVIERAPMRVGSAVFAVYVLLVVVGELYVVGERYYFFASVSYAFEYLVVIWFALAAGLACLQLLKRYRFASRTEAITIKWTFLAILLWFLACTWYLGLNWLALLGVIQPGRFALLVPSTLIVLSGSVVLTFGIFAKGTLDPDLALRRGVMVNCIVAGGVFLFGAVEAALSDWVLARTQLPSGTSLWLAAGVIALLLHPTSEWLRPRVHGWFDRWEIGRGSPQDV